MLRLLVLSLFVGLPALAHAETTVLVLPILLDGKLDYDLAESVSKKMEAVVEDHASYTLAPREPLRALKKPRTLAEDCGRGKACFANLGKLAKADLVMVARASSTKGGISVSFLTVSVAEKKVVGRAKLKFKSKRSVSDILDKNFEQIIGGGDEGDEEPEEKPEATESPTEEPPLAAVTPPTEGGDPVTPAGDETGEEPDIPETTGEEPAIPDTPGEAVEAAAGTEPETTETAGETSPAGDAENAAPPAFKTAALDPFAAAEEPKPAAKATTPGWWEQGPYFSYAGLGLAGVGVASMVVGALYGIRSATARSDTSIDSGVTQLEAARNNRLANSRGRTANTFYVTGGILAAAGAMLFAWDTAERGLFWERE